MELIRNFFELINDMLRNNIALYTMFKYLFFLSPQLIYQMLPISILVAVLAAFGVMSKQNEITAFKACGVSLFRLAAPILVGSVLLSGGLFAFDFYYVASANRIQDALRDQIKGRATQTYLRPDRTWKMGYDSMRIFNYKYFNNSGDESTMVDQRLRLSRLACSARSTRARRIGTSLKTRSSKTAGPAVQRPNCDAPPSSDYLRVLVRVHYCRSALEKAMNFLQLTVISRT
jgi:lipopolysaccharide export LptBFGC system permease protein LptF